MDSSQDHNAQEQKDHNQHQHHQPPQHQGRQHRLAPTSEKYPALDGGWGYLVTVAAFSVAFMLDGTESNYGLLLPHVIKSFGGHVAIASLCGGLVTGVILGTGPLSAFLVRKFGCRRVSFVGSVVASASVVMATLARRIEIFVLFYGLFAGFGMGLVYLPSVTMINAYFDRKRGLFAGIVTSGSGIGLLVISLLTDRLITEYGWRGCYLIIAGVLLNLCVCSSLMRPLEDNYRFSSRKRHNSSSVSTPVTEESLKDLKAVSHGKTPNHVNQLGSFDVSNWVASQPLLPSQRPQMNGELGHELYQSKTRRKHILPQFISLHEGLDLGTRPNGGHERGQAGQAELEKDGLSRSLHTQLDYDPSRLEEIKPPRIHKNGESYTDADVENNLSDAAEFAHKTESNHRNFERQDDLLCQCNNEQENDIYKIRESQVEEITPDTLNNKDVAATRIPSQSPTQPTHCNRCSKTVPVDSEIGHGSTLSPIPISIPQNSVQHRLYEPNHNHKHNHHNHLHHQRFHHHNHHHLHHHHHHHHHQLDQSAAGSHSTLCEASESGSVVSGRPILQKSDLLNVLPELLGSLSTLSVNTVHSAHSVRSRRSLLHQRAGEHHVTGAGDSHTSLNLGSKHTLSESLTLEVPGKDFGGLEEEGIELEQVEHSSCDLFKIVRFDLFCVGAFLVQVASIIPTMFVPSYIVSAGLSTSTAATIVSILGISNTAGRLCAGLLSYLGLGTVRIYNCGTCVAGLACFLLPLCYTFPSLVAFAVCHGFFIGFFPPLQSVILVEQLGLERLPASFGIMCVCKSVASVSGPFLAGALYEWAESYAVPFYLAGSTMMVANIVHCVMSFCPRPADVVT